MGLTSSKLKHSSRNGSNQLRFGISAIFIRYLARENKLPESFQGSLLAEHTKFHQYPAQGAVCKISNKLRLSSIHQALGKEQKISISNYPICSTISLACLIMFAPVWQTMPAISIEYHRALKRKQKYIPYLPVYKSIPCISRPPILEPKNKFFLFPCENFLNPSGLLITYADAELQICISRSLVLQLQSLSIVVKTPSSIIIRVKFQTVGSKLLFWCCCYPPLLLSSVQLGGT